MIKITIVLCIVTLFCDINIIFANFNFSFGVSYNNNIRNNLREHIENLFLRPETTQSFIKRDYIQGPSKILNEYDFIIVGAGPAGCVLANRLTENSNWKVLLIEAGGTEGFFHQVPVLAAYFQSTESNWGYKSVPQNVSCFGMNNNECALPRGKVLGGTSSINYMIYNRGNKRDFNRWAEAGNTGWSYEELLPYFKKSENANLRNLEKSPYHGHSGPLSVEDVPYRTKMVHAFIKSCQEAGLKRVDYNGESQLGVSYVQANTLRGHRHSAAKAYIDPILNRKNLHILTRTRAMKVLIDRNTKVAYGVEFVNQRKVYRVQVRKEVILSAGAFNSPQLLMLSGIGPIGELERVEITPIMDLPVGKIMYDHISHIGPTFILNSTGDTLHARTLNLLDAINFTKGQGRLTVIGGVEALAFIKTPNSKEPEDFPDAEFIFVSGSFASDEGTGLKVGGNIKTEIYDRVYKPLENSDHYTTLIMQFHPKSYGTIRMQDKNPLHWPIIDPQFLTNEEDVEILLNAIKISIEISQSPSMKKLGARLHDIPLPGCENFHFSSDDYWRCSIRTLSYTLHHQVATCKMGPRTDPTTVVDPKLKVHGIKNLRVADTSIIPQPPTAHTNAASYMIGEKAADMIKNDW